MNPLTLFSLFQGGQALGGTGQQMMQGGQNDNPWTPPIPQGPGGMNAGLLPQNYSAMEGFGMDMVGPPMAGGAPMTPQPNALPPMQDQQQQQQPQQGSPWDGMFNLTGTPDNPNVFNKASEGYNQGGLLGSLGYLLTNFNQQ